MLRQGKIIQPTPNVLKSKPVRRLTSYSNGSAMSYLPSWAQPKAAAPVDDFAADVERPKSAAVSQPPPPPSEPVKQTFTAEERSSLSKSHWILRSMYMITAVLLAACAAIAIQSSNSSSSSSSSGLSTGSISSSSSSIGTIFIAIYVFMFAIMLCCFEVGLSVIAKCMSENMGFLYTISGRTVFMCLIAGMCAKLYIFGYIMIAIIAIVLLVHYVLIFRNPKIIPYIFQLHYYADK